MPYTQKMFIPDDEALLVPRNVLQNLHSAARSAYQGMCRIPDPTPEIAAAMYVLDASIDVGHEVLGTSRAYADKYINVVGEITQAQAANVRKILEREGLVDKSEDITDN